MGQPCGLAPDITRIVIRLRFRPAGGCWEWNGAHGNGTGYARLGKRYVHRILYERAYGPIPPGRQIDHLCRNRGCVYPPHLEAVTQRTNLLRGDSPPAKAARRTTCAKGHPLTPENVYMRKDKPARMCRTCANARQRGRRQPNPGIRLKWRAVRQQVLQLRSRGLTFSQIGQALGISRTDAFERYKVAIRNGEGRIGLNSIHQGPDDGNPIAAVD